MRLNRCCTVTVSCRPGRGMFCWGRVAWDWALANRKTLHPSPHCESPFRGMADVACFIICCFPTCAAAWSFFDRPIPLRHESTTSGAWSRRDGRPGQIENTHPRVFRCVFRRGVYFAGATYVDSERWESGNTLKVHIEYFTFFFRVCLLFFFSFHIVVRLVREGRFLCVIEPFIIFFTEIINVLYTQAYAPLPLIELARNGSFSFRLVWGVTILLGCQPFFFHPY